LATDAEDVRHKNWTILAASFFPGELNIGFVTASISALMYEMSRDLSLTAFQCGIVLSTMAISMALFGIITGSLADSFGFARMFGLGMIVATSSSMMRAFVSDFWLLFILSLLTTTGVAISVPCLTKMLTTLFKPESQGLAIGVLALGYRFGSASVLFLVPFLMSLLPSWRYVFLLYGGFGILVTCIFYYVARTSSLSEMTRIDRGHNPTPLLGNIGHVLNVRVVRIAAVSKFFLSGFILSLSAFLPFLLRFAGTPILMTGVLSGVFWLSQGAGVIILPKLSDRIRKRAYLVVYFGLLSSLLALLLVFAWGSPISQLIVIPVFGFIFAGLTEIMWLIPLSDPEVKSRYAGSSTGVLMSLGSTGGIVSSIVIGYLLDATSEVWPPLIFLAVLSLLMAVTAFPARERKPIGENRIRSV